MCRQVEVSASGRSLVQRSPTECGVSECDREAPTMRPRSTVGCRAMNKRTKCMYCRWLLYTRNYGYNYKYFSETCSKGLPPHLPPTVDVHHSELLGCTTAGPQAELHPQDFSVVSVRHPSLAFQLYAYHSTARVLHQHWRRDCLQTTERSEELLLFIFCSRSFLVLHTIPFAAASAVVRPCSPFRLPNGNIFVGALVAALSDLKRFTQRLKGKVFPMLD